MPGFLNPLLQPPLPAIFALIPPLSLWQWLPRTLLLIYTLLTLPLILLCVPISVLFLSSPLCILHTCAPLALHPDAIMPTHSFCGAVLRGWIVYTMSGAVWAITAVGTPPIATEQDVRETVFAHVKIYERVARMAQWVRGKEGKGREERLRIREVRVPVLREEWMRGVVCDVWGKRGREEREKDARGVQGFWMINTLPPVKPSSRDARTSEELSSEHSGQPEMRYARTKNADADEAVREAKVASTKSKRTNNNDPSFNPSNISQHSLSVDIDIELAPHTTDPPTPPTPTSKRKVYLFLSGGGYVTGVPLAHAAIYSLARTFPAESRPLDLSLSPSPSHSSLLPHRAVFAPNIRKALSVADAFPMPLMDALSAYQYLLDVGYEPEEVVLLGDSAGGGMVWSVLAYLCALVQERSAASEAKALGKGSDENDLDEVEGLLSADITAPSCNTQTRASVTRRCLGLPGGVIMVSPWVSLPPAPEAETPYPDFANRPQLLNAARCYLARFPVLPERPDPFASDWAGWRKGLFGRRDRAGSQGDLDVGGNRVGAGDVEKAAQKQADRLDIVNTQKRPALSAHQMPVSLFDWLHTPMFARMTSHHPLYSPCSFPSNSVPHPPLHPVHLQHQQHVTRDSGNPASESPFVRQVLCTIKQNKVKVFIMSASGEWFYHPTRLLAEAMAEAGVDMVYKQEQGLIHCENFVFLAEYGMAGRRLLDAVLDWAGESSR